MKMNPSCGNCGGPTERAEDRHYYCANPDCANCKRVVPSHAELAKLTKEELVNELWGEIQTNIELNAQLRVATQRAPVTPPVPAYVCPQCGKSDCIRQRVMNATPAPVTTPGRDERLVQALPTIIRSLQISVDRAKEDVEARKRQRERMPFDHDNNDALLKCEAWLDDTVEALAAAKEPRG